MSPQKFIWIFPSLLHQWLWRDLGRNLAKRTGLKPLFIIATEEDRPFWENQFNEPLNAEIAVHFDYLTYALNCGKRNVDYESIIEEAVDYEQAHDITLMRDMILGCRHIGRAFILGGKGHPASKVSKTITHQGAVQTCMAINEDFEKMSENYPPGLMIVGGGGGGVYMKSACLIARRNGIPFRSLVHARFADYFLWADSEFEESESFKCFHNAQPEATKSDVDYVRQNLAPTGLSVVGFEQIRKDITWAAIARRIFVNYLRSFYGMLKGYRKNRVGASATQNAAMMVRQRLDRQRLDKLATIKVRNLPAKAKIVYFPLQTEPEHSLNVLSPKHTNQLATAVELALSLPANSILAVKEHPYQIGRRTKGTYEILASLPNVAFLDMDEASIDIIRRADLVAIITSSAGYEAAVLGKPVLHFGESGQALCLPHVYPMNSFSNLDKIKEILSSDTNEAKEKRYRDGARYYLAVEKFCIDMSAFKAHGRMERPNAAELSEITDGLVKTLPLDFS